MLKKILLIAFAIISLSASCSFASRPYVGNRDAWTIHSSFDNQPRKILESAEAAYFFVHQRYYNNTDLSKYYANPTGAIFRYDKSNPDAGLKDLAQIAPISGSDMQLTAVDPSSGLFVIAYSDGGIDLVSANLSVKYIDYLKKSSYPGANFVNAISFCPNSHKIWIATNAGFLRIDPATQSVDLAANWGLKVNDICSVGNAVFAIIEGAPYQRSAGSNSALRSSYAKLPAAVSGNPLRLLPLAENHVAFLSDNGALSMLSFDGATWESATAISANNNMLISAKEYVTNRVEQTLSCTLSGYYIASSAMAYLIDRPATADATPSIKSITLPAGSSNWSSTLDGSTFWFYRNRGKFESRSLSNGTWADASTTLAPNAPLGAMHASFAYSPKHGLITTPASPMRVFNNIEKTFPALPAAYKDGKWSNLAPTHNAPYLTESDATAKKQFEANTISFPVSTPLNIMVDPINPDVLHITSCNTGFASVYLDDPRKTPLLVRPENDKSLDAFSPVYSLMKTATWANVNTCYILGCDNDSNLWVYRTTGMSATEKHTDHNFLVWKAEDRRKPLAEADPKLERNWKSLYVPSELDPQVWVNGILLKHPKNRNRMLLWSQNDADLRNIRLYDFNGTVDDTSDDTISYIRSLRQPNGLEWGPLFGMPYIHSMAESPITGDIVATSSKNVVIIPGGFDVVNEQVDVLLPKAVKADGTEFEAISSPTSCSAIYDEYGRLWVSSLSNGVVGYSADYSTIVGYYTSLNSPLPSDRVFGLGWNPDTKSLFISTDMGIAEVRPDCPDIANNGVTMQPFAVPTEVTPDFGGMVTIYNVPTGYTLRITDNDGNTVRVLEAADNGLAYWDLLGNDGKPVKSGKYTISDASGNAPFTPITLPLLR